MPLFDLIKFNVDQNIPCIVGYDNTDSGDPGNTTHEARAHWAVVFGYVGGAQPKLLATHGWGHYYLWSASPCGGRTNRWTSSGDGARGRTETSGPKPGTMKVGWAGPDTPKKPTALPSSLPNQFDTAVRPAGAVAAFQISHEMDLKRQIVIIWPRARRIFPRPVERRQRQALDGPKG